MSLVVENVTLELGDGEQKVRALDNVSATIAAGTFTAVLGPSGAGKSSLLAVCGGLCSPTQGSVSIDGQKISSLDAGALTKIRLKKIGFVFQQSNLVPALTAVDQLLLLVHMQGRKPNHLDRDRALSLLEEVDMVHRAQHRHFARRANAARDFDNGHATGAGGTRRPCARKSDHSKSRSADLHLASGARGTAAGALQYRGRPQPRGNFASSARLAAAAGACCCGRPHGIDCRGAGFAAA